MTGPNGEKRPQGDIEAAVKIGGMATRQGPKDGPQRERRTLLRDWAAPRPAGMAGMSALVQGLRGGSER